MSQPNARNMAPEELVLSHFSLSPMHPLEDRIRLASENGIRAIGLYIAQFLEWEKSGHEAQEIVDLLAKYEVCLAEIEVISGLGSSGSGGEKALIFEEAAWRMADLFGSRYLQVIGPAGDPISGAKAFGDICDKAGDHGLVVGLEFLPFTDIYSVHDALKIVEGADRPNGGICVDIWHHERGARDLPAIAALPGELITGIQMNDGAAVPILEDYYSDCLANRVAPGAGNFDIAGLVTALRSTGTKVPWSLEAPSTWGWANPQAHIVSLAQGMRKFLS